MMDHSWVLIVAMIGHILCVYCDRLILCTPGGTFIYSDIKDNKRMESLFAAMPDSSPVRSLVLGTIAMFLQFFGYLALGIWMRQYSALWANLMIVGAAMIHTFGLAHHVQGCAAEWIYIKSDHNEEGRKLTAEFFGKTSAVMIGCYAGILLFSIAHFIPVAAGMTALPAWVCVFNLLPLFMIFVMTVRGKYGIPRKTIWINAGYAVLIAALQPVLRNWEWIGVLGAAESLFKGRVYFNLVVYWTHKMKEA